MDVEVMYANETRGSWSFQRARAPVEEAHKLRSDSVLFIILSAEDAERPRLKGCRRVAESHGLDNYMLARLHLNGRSWSMLDGWDDGRFIFKDESMPFKEDCRGPETMSRKPPLGVFHVIFTGITVPDDVWAEALKIFEEGMH